jgi:alanine dehydrogenase
MRIGVPREIKDGEARVGLTPAAVATLQAAGHAVRVETGAGSRIGFGDELYTAAGASIVATAEAIYACELVVKVKELQREEFAQLRPGCIVAGYQQLARDPVLLDEVLARRITCLAYEGVRMPDGARPLLAPMSTIAGLMSGQIAAWALQRREGSLSGSGVLLHTLPGVPRARVLVVGDGVVGQAAVRAFLAFGCQVTLLGNDPVKLRAIEQQGGAGPGTLRTALSCPDELMVRVAEADVVIGAVAIPGRLTSKLITRSMLRTMASGSVFIDIGIDMGGLAETSRQTKLSDPLYVEEGVLHYCVPNIPALVPRAATLALGAATLPFVRLIADVGLKHALQAAPALREGLLVQDGHVVHRALAEDTGRPFVLLPGATEV